MNTQAQKTKYKEPLAIYFVYHPNVKSRVEKIVGFWTELLQKNSKKPFSRSIHIPTFITTSITDSSPKEIISDSEKTLIVLFDSIALRNDSNWDNFYSSLVSNELYTFVRVVLDKEACNCPAQLDNIGYYSYYRDKSEKKLTIQILRSIYCLIKGQSLDRCSLKIFLSHTKANSEGFNYARNLNEIINQIPSINRFFDIYDIPPGANIQDCIDREIPQSTLLIFLSDDFASRQWCQHEIFLAKKFQRPMILVNCTNKGEDRILPYSGNIPSFTFNQSPLEILSNKSNRDSRQIEDIFFEILQYSILESIRCEYTKKLSEDIPKNAEFLIRPPEALDILNLIANENGKSSFVYPDPAVFNIEMELINKVPIRTETLMTCKDQFDFDQLNIGISISNPVIEELNRYHQTLPQLNQLAQELACNLIYRNGCVVYGGDTRKGGFTELLIQASDYTLKRYYQKGLVPSGKSMVKNYLAWPIHNSDEGKSWYANYQHSIDIIKCDYCGQKELIETLDVADVDKSQLINALSFSKMRKKMIEESDIRICVGGEITGYAGFIPGILEELYYSLKQQQPVYLLGGFGGLVSRICEMKNEKDSSFFELEWQKKENSNLEALMGLNEKYSKAPIPTYEQVIKLIESASLNNGLSSEENQRLFVTPYPNEAIQLILKGCSVCLK